jgi:acyl dehydratase
MDSFLQLCRQINYLTKKIMGKLVINSYDEFAAHLGEELGHSEWLQVDQERINMFADATLDHQWIHVDVERAKEESPYKSTIAHGYLTLSLLPYMWDQIIEVNNIKMLVNYGMTDMRFGQPVITGSKVRLVTKLHSIQNLRGICKAEIKFTIEIEGQRKPALEGIAAFLYYFN